MKPQQKINPDIVKLKNFITDIVLNDKEYITTEPEDSNPDLSLLPVHLMYIGRKYYHKPNVKINLVTGYGKTYHFDTYEQAKEFYESFNFES